jgi:quercetin dioxygenase-like cupin family protein
MGETIQLICTSEKENYFRPEGLTRFRKISRRANQFEGLHRETIANKAGYGRNMLPMNMHPAARTTRPTKRKPNMEIKRAGSQPSRNPPEKYFTGTVRLDPLFQAPSPARVAGAAVTFEPGARTAWHTHPLGQTLIVTTGLGWAQREGGPVEEIRPGDVIWFPPGEKHWHGATPTTAMTHYAIQEALDGKAVDWLEKVSDTQYRK